MKLKLIVVWFLLLRFSVEAKVKQQVHPAMTLTSETVILIDKTEEAPVRRAVLDLVRDMKKVFAVAPKVVSVITGAEKNRPLIVISSNGLSTKAFRQAGVTGFESHLVTTAFAGSRNAIVLQGADVRGAIYAIYTFSEKILGIPPLWIWTCYQPALKKQILIAENTYFYFPPPTVKWRAWFPNDRDLLSPWQGKNAENYDALFETMLR